jgi:hypothetical protein
MAFHSSSSHALLQHPAPVPCVIAVEGRIRLSRRAACCPFITRDGPLPARMLGIDPNIPQECWRVHYGDVVVGTIAQCVGNPRRCAKVAMEMRLLSGIAPRRLHQAARSRPSRPRARRSRWHGTSFFRSAPRLIGAYGCWRVTCVNRAAPFRATVPLG